MKRSNPYADEHCSDVSTPYVCIDTLFNKDFLLASDGEYTLSEEEPLFKEQGWQHNGLQTLKKDLNEVKNQLNDYILYDWQWHTNQTNAATEIIRRIKKTVQPELLTQAWCKFYEIISKHPLMPLKRVDNDITSFRSVHLCEAPGAFVSALNHWLKTNAHNVNWNWTAMTLNPYYEGNSYTCMVDDDRFIRHTLEHWYFGLDFTGNIMNLKNLDGLVNKCKDTKEPILLVTADGSIDCTNVPAEQENAVAHLQFCETVACMHLLEKGGNFLLKVFTLFEHESVCLMYLLSCAFIDVIVTKPASSKGGNSEMYVVCLNFKGKDYIMPHLNVLRQHYDVFPQKAMFLKENIPQKFINRVVHCSEFFKRHQIQVIQDNIYVFHSLSYYVILQKLKSIQHEVATRYFEICNLSPLSSKDEIVGREIIEKSINCIMSRINHRESYNQRCKKKKLGLKERLANITTAINEIRPLSTNIFSWNQSSLPNLIIEVGQTVNTLHSSRFCEARILQILKDALNIVQETRSVVCFPPISIDTSEREIDTADKEVDSNCRKLTFQYNDIKYRYHITKKIYEQLRKLQFGQTLVLIGYSLLTQFNVGLLYILSSSFEKVIIEINDVEGYQIHLTVYQPNDCMISFVKRVMDTELDASKLNMMILSLLPILSLYEWPQFPLMMQLNHQMIKQYALHVVKSIEKEEQTDENNL